MNKRELQTKKISEWLQHLRGPWPIHPFVFGVLAFFLSQFVHSRVAVLDGSDSVGYWIQGIPQSLIAGTLVAVPLWVALIIVNSTKNRRIQITIFHLGALTASVAVAVGFGNFHNRALAQIGLDTAKMYIAICIASILAELTENQLRVQADKAQAALVETEHHRLLLLNSEEHTRREVAQFLHNHVQAGLVVAAMQLKHISTQTTGQNKAELNSVISALEEIRSFDVRNASRQLSPDFEILTLDAALVQLMQSYEKTLTAEVVVDPGVMKFPAEMCLGIYRMCEQAVLNAVIHGSSTFCTIRVQHITDQGLTLSIENNGAPVSTDARKLGTGLAVIDAWVHKYNGSWNMTNTPEGTVLFSAQLRSY